MRTIPITVRLNEEEHKKIKTMRLRLRSIRSRIYAPAMQGKRPTATTSERVLGDAEHTL